MQKLTGAAPAIAARNRRAASFGLSPRDYLSLGRLSIAAEKFGVKTTEITKGPFGQGALLKLSGFNNYEVLADGAGQVLLGRVTNDDNRVRLCAGKTNTEAQWDRILGALRNAEGRLPV